MQPNYQQDTLFRMQFSWYMRKINSVIAYRNEQKLLEYQRFVQCWMRTRCSKSQRESLLCGTGRASLSRPRVWCAARHVWAESFVRQGRRNSIGSVPHSAAACCALHSQPNGSSILGARRLSLYRNTSGGQSLCSLLTPALDHHSAESTRRPSTVADTG
jgi:hypothetical protein